MGVYGKAGELIDTLQGAIERGVPMVDLAPQLMTTGLELMRQGAMLMDHCSRTLTRVEGLVTSAEEYFSLQATNSELVRKKLELEIERLERGE